MSIVDVDDPGTWPTPVLEWADAWADEKRGTTEWTSDLKIYEEEELYRMLSGHLVRAYHCTRLLDHERAMILKQGLRPLSAELVLERIRRAYEIGALTDDERRAFEAGQQFAAQGWGERVRWTRDQVCLVFSRGVFEHDAPGVDPLLSIWGGEAIYFPLEKAHGGRLRSMGKPSIVVAGLDLSSPAPLGNHRSSPSLGCCLVAQRLGFENRGSDVFYRGPIAPTNIVTIWQPGDPNYDRHTQLPR